MTWDFSAEDKATIKLYATKGTRDAEKSQFFYPMMYANEGENSKVKYLPDASKFKGLIRVVTDFQSQAGDRVTIPNVPIITGRGVHGNQILRGTGLTNIVGTQDVFIDFFATQIYSGGPLADARIGMDFIKTQKPGLTDWYKRKLEEGFALSLFGLTAPANAATVLTNWNSSESEVFLNNIEAFDTSLIVYAGNATSVGDIDSADVLTGALLTQIETRAKEDLAIPVEPFVIDGEECYLFLTSGRGIEQLLADATFREAHTRVIRDARNPLTQRARWKYGNLYIAEYPKCMKPAANVGRSLLLGAEAMMLAKKENMQFFMNDADDAQRRKALSVTGACGIKPNSINGVRRNALAVDHYVRS